MNNPELSFDQIEDAATFIAPAEPLPQQESKEIFDSFEPEVVTEVDPGLQLAAKEFGVEPHELRPAPPAEKAHESPTKTEAVALVLGKQKFRGGRVIDPDNRPVLEKLVAGGNVSLDAIRNQKKMETDLLLTGRHAFRSFREGKTIVTVASLDKDGFVNYSNYEVSPEKQTLAEAPAYPITEQTHAAEQFDLPSYRTAEHAPATDFAALRGERAPATSDQLQREVSPEREMRVPQQSSATPQTIREIIDHRKDPSGVITMTRYKEQRSIAA